MFNLNLIQYAYVTKPTHVNGNILDVVLSNFDLPDEPSVIGKLPVGLLSDVSNYQPISLLCIISKILEKIIYNHTLSFLSDCFTNHQFGFIPDRSSLQQLLLFINNLITTSVK